jgi:hypothetical protein
MSDALVNALLDNSKAGNPRHYAAVIRATESEEVAVLKAQLDNLKEQMENAAASSEIFGSIRNAILGTGYARRRKATKDDLFGSLSAAPMAGANTTIIDIVTYQTAFIGSFSRMIYEGAELVCNSNIISFDQAKTDLSEQLGEDSKVIGKSRADAILAKLGNAEKDALQSLALEQQVNASAVTNFMTGVRRLGQALMMGEDYCANMLNSFDGYYNRLRHRHTEEGIVVQPWHGIPCPVLTDVAINVWDNLDRAGEIEGGASTREEIGVYTVRRAKAMIEACHSLRVMFANANDFFAMELEDIRATTTALRSTVVALDTILGNSVWKYSPYKFDAYAKELSDAYIDMNLLDIPPEGRTKEALDKSETFALKHRNDCIADIAAMIASERPVDEIVEVALELKLEEKAFLLEENSFFVCKIGTGNSFLGEAPGAIEVMPGEKPTANLDRIWGSGFDEMRHYIAGLHTIKKWAPLYLATSPSFSTDKSNVLLVGPQGCGKTELLRAVGADNGSISIFATGSDFLTCWMGEAQKNPKRLFNEARKLQKASGRDVNILIDEIDQVLKKGDGSSGKVDLSLEFQNLMDGVVAYPGIRIWGATNFPDLIPTPMLRRFARVEIVGEMDQEDREQTLRYYIGNFLPTTEDCEDKYEGWARGLEGATGDILRKVADDVWRGTVRSLIDVNEDLAEEIVTYLVDTYGERFSAQDLSDEDRELIKEMMGEHKVGPLVVQSCITKLLGNQAIKDQIAGASNTYALARQMKRKSQ